MTQNQDFQRSIQDSQDLVERLEHNTVSSQEAREKIAQLLDEMATARGFFVSLLTGDWTFGTNIPPVVIDTIKSHPGHAYTLLARNLVMSCATAARHERADMQELADGSNLVAERCEYIITALNNPAMYRELVDVLSACQNRLKGELTGNSDPGSYSAFLERWSYDMEQLKAVLACLKNVIAKLDALQN